MSTFAVEAKCWNFGD